MEEHAKKKLDPKELEAVENNPKEGLWEDQEKHAPTKELIDFLSKEDLTAEDYERCAKRAEASCPSRTVAKGHRGSFALRSIVWSLRCPSHVPKGV